MFIEMQNLPSYRLFLFLNPQCHFESYNQKLGILLLNKNTKYGNMNYKAMKI